MGVGGGNGTLGDILVFDEWKMHAYFHLFYIPLLGDILSF